MYWALLLVAQACALPGPTAGPPKITPLQSETMGKPNLEQPDAADIAEIQQMMRLVQRMRMEAGQQTPVSNATNSTHLQDQAGSISDQVVSDPWLEDVNGTTKDKTVSVGLGTSPTAPSGASIPVSLPPVPVILCEIMCIGRAFEKCVRPCTWAIACALKSSSDDNIMLKLMPQMLELDSYVQHFDNLGNSLNDSLSVHVQSNEYNHSRTQEALKEEPWLAPDVLAGTPSELIAFPWRNETATAFKQVLSDDLCKHDLLLCSVRDLLGETPTIQLLQTWMSSRISLGTGMQVQEQSQLESKSQTTTGFVLNVFQIMIKPFCQVSRAWPPNREKGYCGWYCGYSKDENCLTTCLADIGCCGFWYCIATKGTNFGALENCQKSYCWTSSIGCDNNIDLSFGALQSMIRRPYDSPNLQMKTDVTKMFPFWKPPYRLDGKSLGAIGLNRVDLYPYRDIGWMGGGIGFRGHTMGSAVYGY